MYETSMDFGNEIFQMQFMRKKKKIIILIKLNIDNLNNINVNFINKFLL